MFMEFFILGLAFFIEGDFFIGIEDGMGDVYKV